MHDDVVKITDGPFAGRFAVLDKYRLLLYDGWHVIALPAE